MFPGAPVVHCGPVGSRWYRRRISSLRSNPPVAISTPRRARTVTGSPSRVTWIPVTRPSWTSAAFQVSGVSSQDRHAAAQQPGPQPRGQRLPQG